MNHCLPSPYGGSLTNVTASQELAAELRAQSASWPSWDLTPRQLCDLELLINGGFSPLSSFMVQADYMSVCSSQRLTDGTLWPIPVVLDVPESVATRLRADAYLALRDAEGVMLAALKVEDVWRPDRSAEAEQVYGTASLAHPGVANLLDETHPYCVGGALRGLSLPAHYDFLSLRRTPADLRAEFESPGLAARRRLPDPQSPSPGALRDDVAGRGGGACKPPHPPGGRLDEAGRR